MMEKPIIARASRMVSGGAALLSISVLADSATEHYRGSFRNPAMVLPLISAGASLAANTRRPDNTAVASGTHIAAMAVGAAGLGFHAWNIARQPGRFRLNSILYKAPIGAPGSLLLTGLLGALASRMAQGRVSPRLVAGVTAIGLAGTVAEAGLLHFRGAYHNPAMWLPVTVPTIATIALARDVTRASPSTTTGALLQATAVLGLVGAAFHVWGIARNMGGWRNWRQNLLAGPPIPAPPSFTGLAVAALGALMVVKGRRRE